MKRYHRINKIILSLSPDFTFTFLFLFLFNSIGKSWASSVEVMAEIARRYGTVNEARLHEPYGPDSAKTMLMKVINDHDTRISMALPLSIRNEAYFKRGEAYLYLGKLEVELYQEKLFPVPGQENHLKGRSKFSNENILHEIFNLLGNAAANLNRIQDPSPEEEKKIAENQLIIELLEMKANKLHVQTMNEALDGVSGEAGKVKNRRCPWIPHILRKLFTKHP